MAAHLTEEEQLEALKRWWNDYGKTVTIAIVGALGVFWGWSQYQSYNAKKTQDNSIAYEKMVAGINALGEKADESAKAEVMTVAKALAGEHSDSLYGNFAQMYIAKTAVEANDFATAKSALEDVVKSAANDAVKELAQVRLARVLVASGEQEAALKILNGKVSEAFASFYSEVKGDLFSGQEKLSEARQAYQSAMDALPPTDFLRRNLLQLKLDNTKVASDMPELAPGHSSAMEPAVNPHATTTAQAGDA